MNSRQSAIGNRQSGPEYFVAEETQPGGLEEGGPVVDYRDLDVWKVAMATVKDVYRITKALPTDERYGLVSQMRRAAVSIPANIAEGYGRDSSGNYVQFLKIAQGSTRELETLVELSRQLDFVPAADAAKTHEALTRISMMLRALIRAIERTAGK